MTSLEQLILNLAEPHLREKTLSELSKIRDRHPDLALLLWDSFGTITVLLQETISVYPFLSPPNLSAAQSTRACHALLLFQCVASHPKTRMPFLLANLFFYLYPFLKTTSNTKPFEYLRLTALGVIGAIVKVDDPEVITFLLSTEIIPLCLRNMENGTELSQTVATFIVEKTLIDDVGLRYICSTAERCYAVCHVLGRMVQSLADFQRPSQRLLKHITRCYLRLSDNDRALWILWHCLPASLKDGTFIQHLDDDEVALGWLLHLLHKVNATPEFSESDANLDCTAGGKK